MPKILIADDSLVVRHALRAQLVAKGAEVVATGGFVEASAVDVTDLDAALLDLDLGDGDGLTLYHALRAKRPTLPIAFFSSEDDTPLGNDARMITTVFSKDRLDDAVAWALSRA
ncbi:MAG: response regulator [Polyangiaceae bacterium]